MMMEINNDQEIERMAHPENFEPLVEIDYNDN